MKKFNVMFVEGFFVGFSEKAERWAPARPDNEVMTAAGAGTKTQPLEENSSVNEEWMSCHLSEQ